MRRPVVPVAQVHSSVIRLTQIVRVKTHAQTELELWWVEELLE